MEPIRTTREGAILTVTLDRPKANAIDLATSRIMGEVFQSFRDDPELRVAVLTAAGKVGDGLASLTGSAEMLTSAKTREILHPDWSSSPSRQPPTDIWRPEIPLTQGLADMATWARAAKKL